MSIRGIDVYLKNNSVYQTIRAVCLHNHGQPLRAMLLGAAIPATLYAGYAIVHVITGTPGAGSALPMALLFSAVLGVVGMLGSLLASVLRMSAHVAKCTLVVRRSGPKFARMLLLVVLGLIPLGAAPATNNVVYAEQEKRPFYVRYIQSNYGLILVDDTSAWSEQEARIVYETLTELEKKIAEVSEAGQDARAVLEFAWGGVRLVRMARTNNPFGNFAWTPPGYAGRRIEVPDYAPENGWWKNERWTKHVLSDELAHAWDFLYPDVAGWNGGHLSSELASYVGADASLCLTRLVCGLGDNASVYNPGEENPTSIHSAQSPVEDWSGSFAQYIEPLPDQTLGPKRNAFVKSRLELLASRIR